MEITNSKAFPSLVQFHKFFALPCDGNRVSKVGIEDSIGAAWGQMLDLIRSSGSFS